MEDYVRVRRLHFEEGMSIREIHRRTGFTRRTIKKMIVQGAPTPYKRKARPSKLDPFCPVIDAILEADRKAPRKQRHSAARIWERLVEEHGYAGGYTLVRVYVREKRARLRESYVPLALGPEVAQVDWGEAQAMGPDGPLKTHLFVLTLPWSNARFVMAFPRQTQEFFFEGHLRAFEFLGGVPARIIYDNLKAAVQRVMRGRERELNKAFASFSEHFLFEPSFCNPRRGNEKGHVESGVKWAQRRLMTPVPEFRDWRSFNKGLAEACRRLMEEPSTTTGQTIAGRLEEQHGHLRPIPTVKPRSLQPRPARVDSLCLVRFDNVSYSVPNVYAHREVMIHGDVYDVRVYCQDCCIAAHDRHHGSSNAIYDPVHYLGLVERKPRTLDDGAPMKKLQLPECFALLRRRMEANQRYSKGTRAYIRTLRFLEHYPLADLTRAVQRAIDLGAEEVEIVRNLLLCPPEMKPTLLDLSGRSHLFYPIKPPDLSRYGQLAGEVSA